MEIKAKGHVSIMVDVSNSYITVKIHDILYFSDI